jgi:long-chain acyl-CoA synthetase
VRIDDPNSDGIGEIAVKGESVMLGYYENEEATSKVLKDGWFYTGDIGYMDNEKFVYITGRKKNVIVTKNGKNIYPEEIETILSKCPYILESLVYGKKEAGSDETIVAATIVPNMDYIKESNGGNEPSSEEIREIIQKEIKAINKGLVIYKYIKEFDIRMEEFAKTTTKKIKRYQN